MRKTRIKFDDPPQSRLNCAKTINRNVTVRNVKDRAQECFNAVNVVNVFVRFNILKVLIMASYWNLLS